MTRDEHQAQEVVADVFVDRRLDVRHADLLLDLELATELLMLALEHYAAADLVDCPMLGRAHEPGAGVVRDARFWPALECSDERILGKLLGQAYVAEDAGEAGDQPGRLHPPDCVDDATYPL